MRKQLREQEDLFWELNVQNIEEQTRLKILEGLAYSQQEEEQARDLTDFLTDSERFPRISGLGRPQKRAEPEQSSSVPNAKVLHWIRPGSSLDPGFYMF